MKKHINIPIFIPHYGCPNACVFCNQKKITGKPSYSRENVTQEIDAALSTVSPSFSEIELAFFGGSFTAIPQNEMDGLLSISDTYLKSGKITSVRLSTRPDAISPEILETLASHGVKTIELGIQSFSDTVLDASKRGHSAKDSETACRLIKEYGFKLIGQMMVGLPKSTIEDEMLTAEKICSLGADGARVYPTVVFPETELKNMQKCGDYSPLSVNDAVFRTSKVLEVFINHSVPVIRIGLCSNDTLEDLSYSENYHPSVGELALNLIYLRKMRTLLDAVGFKNNNLEIDSRFKNDSNLEIDTKFKNDNNLEIDTVCFFVAKGKISQAIGQNKSNVISLKEEYGIKNIKIIEKSQLCGFDTELDFKRKDSHQCG